MPRITPEAMIGQRFGKLTVTGEAPQAKRSMGGLWYCACDCGGTTAVLRQNLRNGSTISCGCASSRRTIGDRRRTHGKRGSPLYAVWSSMRQRCGNPRHSDWPNYGGRGIKVCERWSKFANFDADMAASWQPGLTLERDDVDGDYGPNNCRWIPAAEQSRNRRNTPLLETPWGKLTRPEAARALGLSLSAFRERLEKGWTAERLFAPPQEDMRRAPFLPFP